jgi:hypothetical protein
MKTNFEHLKVYGGEADECFRGRCSWPFSSCLAAQIHKQLSRGFLVRRKMHKESIWMDKNFNKFLGIFREGSEAQIFLSVS